MNEIVEKMREFTLLVETKNMSSLALVVSEDNMLCSSDYRMNNGNNDFDKYTDLLLTAFSYSDSMDNFDVEIFISKLRKAYGENGEKLNG